MNIERKELQEAVSEIIKNDIDKGIEALNVEELRDKVASALTKEELEASNTKVAELMEKSINELRDEVSKSIEDRPVEQKFDNDAILRPFDQRYERTSQGWKFDGDQLEIVKSVAVNKALTGTGPGVAGAAEGGATVGWYPAQGRNAFMQDIYVQREGGNSESFKILDVNGISFQQRANTGVAFNGNINSNEKVVQYELNEFSADWGRVEAEDAPRVVPLIEEGIMKAKEKREGEMIFSAIDAVTSASQANARNPIVRSGVAKGARGLPTAGNVLGKIAEMLGALDSDYQEDTNVLHVNSQLFGRIQAGAAEGSGLAYDVARRAFTIFGLALRSNSRLQNGANDNDVIGLAGALDQFVGIGIRNDLSIELNEYTKPGSTTVYARFRAKAFTMNKEAAVSLVVGT